MFIHKKNIAILGLALCFGAAFDASPASALQRKALPYICEEGTITQDNGTVGQYFCGWGCTGVPSGGYSGGGQTITAPNLTDANNECSSLLYNWCVEHGCSGGAGL